MQKGSLLHRTYQFFHSQFQRHPIFHKAISVRADGCADLQFCLGIVCSSVSNFLFSSFFFLFFLSGASYFVQ